MTGFTSLEAQEETGERDKTDKFVYYTDISYVLWQVGFINSTI